MHRFIAWALACGLVLLATQAARAAELPVGVQLSLSGNDASAGRDSKRGIDLALHALEPRLAGNTIVIREVDDTSNPNQAVTAVQRLVSGGVIAIVGGTVSNVVRAVLPVAQRGGVPYAIVNSFAPSLVDVGDCVFQVSAPTSAFNRQEVAEAAKAFHFKRAAMLWAQDNPTTVSFRDDFLAAFKQAGVPVVVDEPMRALDNDYSAQLQKAMNEQADVLVANFNGAQNAAVIKQAHSIGYHPITLGHVGDVNASFLVPGGKDVIGHIANAGFFAGATTAPVQAFVAAYRAAYNDTPPAVAAQGYQAMMMVGEAIAREIARGETPSAASLRKELTMLGPMPSVLGSTGTAEFQDRVLRYDGVLLRLGDDLKWQIWRP